MTKEELAAELGIPASKIDELKKLLKGNTTSQEQKKPFKNYPKNKLVVTYQNTCRFCEHEWNVVEEVTSVNAPRSGCIIKRTFSHCNRCTSRLSLLHKEIIIKKALQMLSVHEMPLLSQCVCWNSKNAEVVVYKNDEDVPDNIILIQYTEEDE